MENEDPRIPKRPSKLRVALDAVRRDLQTAERDYAVLSTRLPRLRELVIQLEQEIDEAVSPRERV